MEVYTKEWIICDKVNVEGGYVDHPNDPGKATNHGITEAVARAHGFKGDMRDLTKEEAVAIYKVSYWDKMMLDDIYDRSILIADKMFDMGINLGVHKTSELFQRYLTINNQLGDIYPDLIVDGYIGPKTIEGFDSFIAYRGKRGKINCLTALLCGQGDHYCRLAMAREKSEAFIHGWMNRVGKDIMEYATLIDSGRYT
ncbi:glycoside hydrolase family 108 protein [Endozoicomonas sp. ONNA1]|uniref:glycoside hydrolase family 108 protein n=1 Tax=Endozoicomonas sp. ONNA1 TaxID=2828740 RepID=UPI00214767B0|nr:glycosyl hydrolase 108 family protein [Endozoicomonas sp. ONNA1]